MSEISICKLYDESDPVMKLNFTKGSTYAAGYDLCADHDTVIGAGDAGVICTGLKIAIPYGCYGRISGRSGLALRNEIGIGGGVIDPDYTGEVKIIIFNHGIRDFVVKRGNRVAQIIFEKIEVFSSVLSVNRLDASDAYAEANARGGNGFGSTGR